MIMTVGEAHVVKENWQALQDAYAARVKHLEPGMVQTYLVHGLNDPTLWQIVTIWTSLEALRELRQTRPTPVGDLIFQEAGAEPAHAVYEIVTEVKAG